MTPHIKAKQGEIAKTVLMPGDPLRAKFMAERFLTDFKQVNFIRNMFMYTGKYKGKKISICASGMGQSSMGIYSYELFKFYGVENIIRIGSAGSYKKNLKLYDVVIVKEAYSDSNVFNKFVLGVDDHIMKPSKELNNKIIDLAKNIGIKLYEVRAHSSDVFYSSRSLEQTILETKADCVEMESAALFANAKLFGKNAACLLTISDNLITREVTTPEERQNTFTDMVQLALALV